MGSNIISRNRSLFNELSKKDTPMEDQEYLTLTYSDFFAENSDKKIKGKDLGEKFAAINSFFLEYLKGYHIPTAYIRSQDKNSLKFIKHELFPFVVKIVNTVDKRTAKIFDRNEGDLLNLPIYEIHYGEDKDSLISESHLIAFDLCTTEEIKLINRICSKVNAVLKSFFERRNEILAEFTCYFGKNEDKLLLVNDFTPRSLIILPADKDEKFVDPYKITTSNEAKKYTEHLFNLMSA